MDNEITDNGEILKGLKEICEFSKSSKPIMRRWITKHNFPAFRAPEERVWRAMKSDVDEWYSNCRQEYSL